MSARLRLVVVLTHPVQYLSPWFRYIHQRVPALDLTVVYGTEPTPAQQGVGFGRELVWDVPLRDGYRSVVVRSPAPEAAMGADSFFGLDVPEIVDTLRALDPDVALVPGWHSITYVRAIRALRRAGVPLLYRGDTHLGTISRRWRWLSTKRARAMLRQFSGYLAVGTCARAYLRAMGAPDPAIVDSPHAVDTDWFAERASRARRQRDEIRGRFGFSPADRVILFAGKLRAIKRPADAIEVAARLDGGVALIVGEGPERPALEARARACGVRAVFAGLLNQTEIVDAYVAADALVLTGRETWGLVANEALACGTPVVLSDSVGAAPDLETAGVCAMVPSGEIGRCAEALAAIVDRHRAGASTPESCVAVARRFSFAAATAGLLTAARFAHRNARRPAGTARVVALCGNLVVPGGMERATLEVLGALRRGDADVHALLNGWSSRPIAALAEARDVSWEVGHYDAPLDGVFRRPHRALRAALEAVRANRHLLKLFSARGITHVLAADFRAVLFHAPALLSARWRGIPVMLRSGVAPAPKPLHARLWRWIIAPLASQHVANSDYIARELRAVGVHPSRLTVIANAPFQRSVSPPAARTRDLRRVVYVGQIIPEKGVLPLLDAIGLLVARGHDVRLDIAGEIDGWAPADVTEYRQAVRSRAAAHDLAGRVRFLGWREDVEAVFAEAGLHCCPSQPEQREGFGNVVVEAKRAGVPSVVCPSGALPDMIEHPRDGWVASGFDAAAIAEGLEWFLSDDARLRAASHAARRSSRRYDSRVFEREWQALFGLGGAGLEPRVPLTMETRA